jgi:hypothetical protein
MRHKILGLYDIVNLTRQANAQAVNPVDSCDAALLGGIRGILFTLKRQIGKAVTCERY